MGKGRIGSMRMRESGRVAGQAYLYGGVVGGATGRIDCQWWVVGSVKWGYGLDMALKVKRMGSDIREFQFAR
jgi:hypothetical protein